MSNMMYSKGKGEEQSMEGKMEKLKYSSIVGKRNLETESVLWPKSMFVGAASTINDPDNHWKNNYIPLCCKFLPFTEWGH